MLQIRQNRVPFVSFFEWLLAKEVEATLEASQPGGLYRLPTLKLEQAAKHKPMQIG